MVDFTQDVDLIYPAEINMATTIQSNEDGSERRLAGLLSPIYIFALEMRSISNSERATLESFFNARKGSFGTFQWLNPIDGVNYTVRFEEGSLEFEKRTENRWNCGFRFRQVLG